MQTSYRIDPTPAGWRVARVSADTPFEGLDAVVHRLRDVAEAYAAAAAALEDYLASLDRGEDAADLFEAWRMRDDRYELMAIERKDAPIIVALSADDLWPASPTRH